MTDVTAEDNDINRVCAHMKPMSVSRCANMVAHHKALNRRGAWKVKSLFCYCFPATSDECVLPNNASCEKYCQHRDSHWRCYHKEFTYASDEDSCQDMFNQIQQVIGDILPKYDNNYMICTEVPSKDDNKNKRNIHFSPEVTNIAVRNEFDKFLKNNCKNACAYWW